VQDPDLDLRIASDCYETKGADEYASDTVGVRAVVLGDDGAAFPHVPVGAIKSVPEKCCDAGVGRAHAAVELAGQRLTRWQERDAQHLLRGADLGSYQLPIGSIPPSSVYLAEEAVGALERVAVPELGVLVADRHELVAWGVGVEAARVNVRHVGVGLAQSDPGAPVIQH
jgi:hypothetical protein